MDFVYNEEQEMLRDSVDRYGREKWSPGSRHVMLAADADERRRRWREMAELGWLMLPIAEADGGLGGSAIDVMAVSEGIGRHLIVVPYVSTCVLVPALVGGSPAAADLLAGIGTGEMIAAAALFEDGDQDPSVVGTRAERDGDAWRVTGAKSHVEDGADADWFVVSARIPDSVGDDPDGIGLFLVEATAESVRVERFRAIDGHRHARVALEGANAVALGEPGGALPLIEAAVDRAICAQLAEATGSMEAAATATLEYVQSRKQFGVAIGSFQVIQHRMVDMTIACEEARAMTYHATLHLHRDPAVRRRAVSAGKVRVGQSGLYVGQQAVQLHGGVGFSEELIVSHHLRRQMMVDLAYGNADHHRARHAATEPEQVAA